MKNILAAAFIVQILLCLGWLWFLTKLEYFKNLFLGFGLISVTIGSYLFFVAKFNPVDFAQISRSASLRAVTPGWLAGADWKTLNLWALAINAGLIVLGLIVIYLYRKLSPIIQEKIYALKQRLYAKPADKDLPVVEDVANEVRPGLFFFGVSKDGPVYLDKKALTHHVQVVGPSGTGKTKSILFPLAMQAVKEGIPLIFVDGKGDAGLIKDFQAVDSGVLVFNPLDPEHSNSYNPLCSSIDPAELMNMLAVALNLDAPGEAKVYTDIQKKYLLSLLALFLSTGKPFSFTDILEFSSYVDSREPVLKQSSEQLYKEDIKVFFSRLSKNEKELIGLTTILDQLFVADARISGLINSYTPDIDIKTIMTENKRALFSFSTGKKAQTNEALAKMVLSDIANAVGERQSKGQNDFMLLILDEFGQYVSGAFDKFISTCRSANVGVILSHQTNAQLITRDGSDRLAVVVRENTATKVIMRQAEEASFWAETFGTAKTFKYTDQVADGAFGTQGVTGTGSLREVDEFHVHPNVFRQLPVGRAVFKTADKLPVVINCGMWSVTEKVKEIKPNLKMKESKGLDLRTERLNERVDVRGSK